MSTASITLDTRMILQDTGVPFACNVLVDGFSTVFDLPVECISQTAYPPTVILDGTNISNGATVPYIFDYKHGVISFETPPGPANTVLGVQGWYYNFFIDSEIAQAVTDGFAQHTVDDDPPRYIDPTLGQCGVPVSQEILVALLAAREALWFYATDASQVVDVHTPEGVFIPRTQRYAQILKQIDDLEEEYRTIAGAMGVGLYRIQVVNMRRLSYTTNRLVPIFREQEYNQPYTGFYPTTGVPGTIVTINGKYFTAAGQPIVTQVTFGGVPAVFNVVDDEHVQATVPVGAVTGQIGITTSAPGGGGGVVLSTAQFAVGAPAPDIDYGPEFLHISIPRGK